MRTFLTLLRVEWVKTMRMLSTYIAFAAAGLLVVMIQMGVYFTSDRSGEYRWLKQQGFDTSLLVNAYVTTRMVMEIGFVLLLAPMVIQVFARQVAGEDLRGTLRLILSRPISRMALVNAKFMVCTAYCIMLMGFTLTISYLMGLALYGPHDAITIGSFRELDSGKYSNQAKSIFDEDKEKKENLALDADARKYVEEKYKEELKARGPAAFTDKRLVRRMSEDYMGYVLTKNVISPRECVKRLFIAWLLTSWALVTVGAIALFYSVINKHPISAMALTVGTFFMVMILQGLASQDNIMQLFKDLKPYLFTTAMDYYRECMSFTVNWEKIWKDGTLLGCYTLFFYGVSQLIFWRKDITS